MDKRIKARWLKALRSGKYKQTTGMLKRIEDNGQPTFCCLGVLCDLHARTKQGKSWEGDTTYDGSTLTLPESVVAWAKLPDQSPDLEGSELTEMNDSMEYSFKRIATLIEKYL